MQKQISYICMMSVYGYVGRRIELCQNQYVVFLSRTYYPHCISRLGYEMSAKWKKSREVCWFSAMSISEEIAFKNQRKSAQFDRSITQHSNNCYVFC